MIRAYQERLRRGGRALRRPRRQVHGRRRARLFRLAAGARGRRRARGAGRARARRGGRRGWQTPTGEPLAARVGIATGLVVVGDLIGEGAAQEEAVVGETPNLAARLQSARRAGQRGDRRRRPGGWSAACSSSTISGRSASRASPSRSRPGGCSARAGREPLRGARRRGLTPLVGREQELALLLDALAAGQGRRGPGGAASGEPGIGKSRIVRALRERLRRRAAHRGCATSARPTTPTARSIR